MKILRNTSNVKSLLLLALILALFGFNMMQNNEETFFDNTKWRILKINLVENGIEKDWRDFSNEQKFILSFSKTSIKNKVVNYHASLTSDSLNLRSGYACQIKNGYMSIDKNNLNKFDIRLLIDKGCFIDKTNLYIPLYAAFLSSRGVYTLKNDTLVFLKMSDSKETNTTLKTYLVKY